MRAPLIAPTGTLAPTPLASKVAVSLVLEAMVAVQCVVDDRSFAQALRPSVACELEGASAEVTSRLRVDAPRS